MDCPVERPYGSGLLSSGGEPLRPGGLELTQLVLQRARFRAGQRILDLGCGQGASGAELLRLGCRPIGVDPSRLSLACARDRGAALVAASGHRLPFADGSIDGILAECSLSVMERRRAALAECHRVLAPGGRLAITDVYARDPAEPGGQPLPGCLADMISIKDLLPQLAAAGFRVERWEDHSAVLKTFAARLIFERGSLDALWSWAPGASGGGLTQALKRRRPGYFLLIAAKAKEPR